jgi:chromate transporter
MCVYFGTLARGRIGGLLAGLGFMLPGTVLIVLLSWAYLSIDLASPPLRGAFAGAQAAVVALVVRAVHRIGEHAVRGPWLLAIALAAFGASLLGVAFLPILAVAGATQALAARGRTRAVLAVASASMAGVVLYALAAPQTLGAVTAAGPAQAAPGQATAWELLLTGLKAGLLTFGGAYTAIPFVREDAVGGGWMTDRQFLDGIALSGILPAPLVVFATFVGAFAGGAIGALAITVAIFLPAFAFTLIGHRLMERLISTPSIHAFLDGVTAGVVGLIAATSLELFRSGVTDVAAAAVFLAALVTLYRWRWKGAVAAVVLAGGALGALLFR